MSTLPIPSPLDTGGRMAGEQASEWATGIFSLFTDLLLALVDMFIFFPNPATITSLDQLYWTSFGLFFLIVIIGAMSHMGTIQFFPSEGTEPFRYVQRTLIALIVIAVGPPFIGMVVEGTHLVARYFYPVNFDLQFGAAALKDPLAALLGTGLTYAIAIIGLYLIGILSAMLFLGILAIRAFLIYVLYGTLPLIMAFWVFDTGLMKYGYDVSNVIFRGSGVLLAYGILVAVVLGTGGAIASADAGFGQPADPAASAGTAYYPSNVDTDVGATPDQTNTDLSTRQVIAIKIASVFGSIWAAAALGITTFGILMSVGSGAAARSAARAQQRTPGGSADISKDPGASQGDYQGSRGSTPPNAQPGPAGPGPTDDRQYVDPDAMPSHKNRDISEQVGDGIRSAKGKINEKGLTGAASETVASVKQATSDSIPESTGIAAWQGFKKTARGMDKTADYIASRPHDSPREMAGAAADHVRENPIVGERKTAAEVLDESGANGITFEKSGDPRIFSETAQARIDKIGESVDADTNPFDPNEAEAFEKVGEQEVFDDIDPKSDVYRARMPGYYDDLVIANLDKADLGRVMSRSKAEHFINEDTSLELNRPTVIADPDSGNVAITEKQGASPEALKEEGKLNDVDKDSYIDQVAGSILVGDKDGARGKVRFDSDGQAFSPNVDETGEELSFAPDRDETESLDDVIKEAAERGNVAETDIRHRLETVAAEGGASHPTQDFDDLHPGQQKKLNEAFENSPDDDFEAWYRTQGGQVIENLDETTRESVAKKTYRFTKQDLGQDVGWEEAETPEQRSGEAEKTVRSVENNWSAMVATSQAISGQKSGETPTGTEGHRDTI